ncbi:MAG: endonuclease Q family protein [Candidatus Micrarchaeia archaeon]|jgi:uncharacterized protein (TIGR00375 family)
MPTVPFSGNSAQQGGNNLLFADLHLHSKYSRAVSPAMDLEHLSRGGRLKGLQIIGTGDFTHPVWFAELRKKLVPAEGAPGLFELSAEGGGKKSRVLFMLTAEVATFFSQGGKSRKVHHVLHVPSFDDALHLNEAFSKRSNLSADGRPMFANTSCEEMAEIFYSHSPKGALVPAHAWTPWFGVFGSESGYDSLSEAFGSQSKNIFAIETGMSSDPAMNWRVSSLDKIALMSNSDSHSPYPWRLGRECNAFTIPEEKISFETLFGAVREKDASRFAFTLEVNPSYGKYHVDGHRLCNFSSLPPETKKLRGICPVCKRPLTIGVLNRVEELADRPEGFVPKNAIPFKSILPLHELVAACHASSLSSKRVSEDGAKLMAAFGSELNVLLSAPESGIAKVVHEKIASAIMLNRMGKIEVAPGYDGEYGIAKIPAELLLGEPKAGRESKKQEQTPLPQALEQKSLGEF